MASRSPQDTAKHAVAEKAAAMVEDKMVLGLGSGSTMRLTLLSIGRRIQAEGLSLKGVPTSEATAVLAREQGIELVELDARPELDLAFDGADEVVPGSFALTKGLGGALLREKLVAIAASWLVILVDDGKLVDQLGSRSPIPVEVVPFAHKTTARRLAKLGGEPVLRLASDGTPFRSDGGNLIYDLKMPPIGAPEGLAAAIKGITGVVEHGIFLGMAKDVIVGNADGTTRRLPAVLSRVDNGT
ncbi:ribose-5-phosphate isomerase [Arboricoccus pini]|uniref:Ribose-5-phosphate isomerase A n=1 Tax=Arboricoccus pini TaxID=1963835 RepID=A0A212RQY2_9PROT|nr:ribose 5-phosphate isomerase A [Arboricoccus pini]SNB75010.1 ribose-5-phosphate isomerase [Arboricoccus pini]